MLSFVLVDAAGAEVRAVDSPSGELLGAPGEGMQWVEVPYPVKEWTVSLEDGAYVAVPRVRSAARALEVAKALKIQQIFERRRAFEQSVISINGLTFSADETSRNMLSNALVLAREFEETSSGQSFSTVWKTNTGASVTLNRAQLRGVALVLGQRVQQAFAQEAFLRTQVEAATTVELVNAVTWVNPT